MGEAAETLAALRAAVARVEGRGADARGRRIALGVGEIDLALGGGLRRGALHAVSAASPSAEGVATGFAGALAALAAGEKGAVLWIRQDMSARESGEIWGPGLAALGLDPRRLALVRAPDAVAVLKAAEAGLASQAVAAVVIEPFGAMAGFDGLAGRRLALAAGRSGALGLLLGLASSRHVPAGFFAAETRWRVAPLSSAWGAAESAAPAPDEFLEPGWGRPIARAELIRNRLGAVGRWPLAWGFDDGLFRPAVRLRFAALDPGSRPGLGATQDFGDRAAGSVDRPDQAARAGEGASRRAG